MQAEKMGKESLSIKKAVSKKKES
jgi:hypothetical protein